MKEEEHFKVGTACRAGLSSNARTAQERTSDKRRKIWYRLADLCTARNFPSLLGHALYLKAIHGGKTKTADFSSGIQATAILVISTRRP